MDKRYQVFVSSTYDDLREARQEVMQALLELDCIPAGMELFPAANEDQWTLIKEVIDDCDYYIVIIAGRYGSIGPDGISYTHMEYEYAIEQKKPVIAFIHKTPEDLPAKKCEKIKGNIQKLEAFRELAQKKACRFWTTPADLGSVVSRSLIKLIKRNPAIGWVRADLLPDKETTEEILQLKKRIEALQAELEQTQSTSAEGTEEFAQGKDTIEIRYTFGKSDPGQRFKTIKVYENKFNTTWDDLFSVISPLLIDEASDRELKIALNNFIVERNASTLKGIEDLVGYDLRNFNINDEDFNTVKVQLLALRLIAKSTKKKNRSVSDNNAYWMLSLLGEKKMTELRAIRRETN